MKKIIMLLVVAMATLSLNGCLVAAAAGAAGGYKAHEEGYRLQAPVRKDPQY
ncbi:MAG: hypothetical protein HKN82_01720 [Akkermansiaceae bacterium]|nr:hypothetical protein [Akkermansiaceae bacterium]NNM28571.1 hypothetical protein [Akkermansiaceae bacterium]